MSAAGEAFGAALPTGPGVTLLTRDPNGLIAFHKPAGVLSHPNSGDDEARALLTARYVTDGEYFEWTAQGGNGSRLWLLNRLDFATSGVILAAESAELAAEIRAHFKRRQVRKVYHALVFGRPPATNELWRDLLAVDKRGGRIRTAAGAGNVPAETRMHVVRAANVSRPLALLRLEPKTGRSHQLRVQAAKRSLPIVGDAVYGDFRANRDFAKAAGTKRMFLHSSETSFEYEFQGRRSVFSAVAPLPPEFEKFL